MGLVVFFKAGLVGGFGLIIAIVAVIALLTAASEGFRLTNISIPILPALITLIAIWSIGWGIAYYYFSIIKNSSSDEIVLTIFACLFTLTPSLSFVAAAFSYYVKAQKLLHMVNKEKIN